MARGHELDQDAVGVDEEAGARRLHTHSHQAFRQRGQVGDADREVRHAEVVEQDALAVGVLVLSQGDRDAAARCRASPSGGPPAACGAPGS